MKNGISSIEDGRAAYFVKCLATLTFDNSTKNIMIHSFAIKFQ